jgi:transposase
MEYISLELGLHKFIGSLTNTKEIIYRPKQKILNDWVKQAKESKVPQLIKMAGTIMAYRTGILAWYDCHISTGKVEGINNKIKVMKRTAYGFRNERYFELRLYALHDCRITRNVG